MMKLTIVLIMITLAHAIKDKDCDKGPFKLEYSVKVCSRLLSCLVENLCSNNFRIIKRDTTSVMMHKLVPDDLYDFAAKKSMVASVRSRLRPRREIANECCDNSCSIENILAYCAPDAKIFETFPLDDA